MPWFCCLTMLRVLRPSAALQMSIAGVSAVWFSQPLVSLVVLQKGSRRGEGERRGHRSASTDHRRKGVTPSHAHDTRLVPLAMSALGLGSLSSHWVVPRAE